MPSNKRMHDGSEPIHPGTVGAETSGKLKAHADDITSILDNLVGAASVLISDSGIWDDGIRHQLEALRDARGIRFDKRVKIGVVGASEMGKSSTVNALIHTRELCKTDSGIEGCTSATCEITGADSDQACPYLVHVTFYDEHQVTKMLKDYVHDFCLLKFDKGDEVERGGEEQIRLASSAATLLQLIATLAITGTGLSTEIEVARVIEHHYSEKTLDKYTKVLSRRCCALVKGFTGSDDVTKTFQFHDSDSVINFSHALGSTNDNEAASKSLWPLVKRLKIHIKDNHFLQDLIIGDAPGISDTNQCRVRNSEEFLEECDFLLVITSTQVRIAGDTTVTKILHDYGERFRGKLALIITRADEEIESTHMSRHLGSASGMGLTADVNAYRHTVEEIKKIASKYSYRRLTELERFQRREELKPLEQSKFALGLNVRNNVFKNRLIRRLQREVPIVFVSNKHYWRHVHSQDDDEYDTDDGSKTLDLLSTGIPTLRRLLTGLPMQSVYRSIDEYLHCFHSFTEAVKGVTDRNASRDLSLTKQLTDNFMNSVISQTSLETSFRVLVRQYFVIPFVVKEEGYVAGAVDFFESLGELNHASIRATIVRRGVFNSRTKVKHDWPEALTGCILPDLQKAFSEMAVAADAITDKVQSELFTKIDDLASRVSANKYSVNVTDQALKDMVGSCKHLVELHIELFALEHSKDIANVKLNATKQRDGNYFQQSLMPLYAELEDITGIGSKNRIIAASQAYAAAGGDSGFIKPSLKAITNALHAVNKTHAKKLNVLILRDLGFLCSKLTCATQNRGAFEAAQKRGSLFLDKAEKDSRLLSHMMAELKKEIDAWVVLSGQDTLGSVTAPIEMGDDGGDDVDDDNVPQAGEGGAVNGMAGKPLRPVMAAGASPGKGGDSTMVDHHSLVAAVRQEMETG